MQYVIIFDKPIRIGLHILESVGPFEDIGAAKYWYIHENVKSVMPLPEYKIISMVKPEII